jgi:cyclophilin family peptidyl-prolyl cis-trans isomerase
MQHVSRAFFYLICTTLLFFSCDPKREVVTQQNLQEVLTRYGQQNPETEVLIETEFGNMRLKLYEDTPLHRANFVKLIKEGQYEDADFYRVFYRFMIQGGSPDNQLPYRIPAEFNTKYFHKKGALSMAREDENNPNLESSSTEFFIVQGGKYADYQVEEEANTLGLNLTDEQKKVYMDIGGYISLDQQYTVFGEVTEGLDVIDKIAGVKVFNEDKPIRKIPFRISVVK